MCAKKRKKKIPKYPTGGPALYKPQVTGWDPSTGWSGGSAPTGVNTWINSWFGNNNAPPSNAFGIPGSNWMGASSSPQLNQMVYSTNNMWNQLQSSYTPSADPTASNWGSLPQTQQESYLDIPASQLGTLNQGDHMDAWERAEENYQREQQKLYGQQQVAAGQLDQYETPIKSGMLLFQGQQGYNDYLQGKAMGSPLTPTRGFYGKFGGNVPKAQEGMENQEPVAIQAEKGEFVVFEDGSITPVKAKKTHKQMKDDDVTDILPPGSYIMSRDKKMKINKKGSVGGNKITDISFGYTPIEYKEGESSSAPEEIMFSDIMSKNKMTPAELTKVIQRKYPMSSREDDVFAKVARDENKSSRAPYTQTLIQLSEMKKPKKKVPQYQDGGFIEEPTWGFNRHGHTYFPASLRGRALGMNRRFRDPRSTPGLNSLPIPRSQSPIGNFPLPELTDLPHEKVRWQYDDLGRDRLTLPEGFNSEYEDRSGLPPTAKSKAKNAVTFDGAIKKNKVMHLAGDKTWEYMKDGSGWKTRRQGDTKWIRAKDDALTAIKTAFGDDKKSTSSIERYDPLDDIRDFLFNQGSVGPVSNNSNSVAATMGGDQPVFSVPKNIRRIEPNINPYTGQVIPAFNQGYQMGGMLSPNFNNSNAALFGLESIDPVAKQDNNMKNMGIYPRTMMSQNPFMGIKINNSFFPKMRHGGRVRKYPLGDYVYDDHQSGAIFGSGRKSTNSMIDQMQDYYRNYYGDIALPYNRASGMFNMLGILGQQESAADPEYLHGNEYFSRLDNLRSDIDRGFGRQEAYIDSLGDQTNSAMRLGLQAGYRPSDLAAMQANRLREQNAQRANLFGQRLQYTDRYGMQGLTAGDTFAGRRNQRLGYLGDFRNRRIGNLASNMAGTLNREADLHKAQLDTASQLESQRIRGNTWTDIGNAITDAVDIGTSIYGAVTGGGGGRARPRSREELELYPEGYQFGQNFEPAPPLTLNMYGNTPQFSSPIQAPPLIPNSQPSWYGVYPQQGLYNYFGG